MFDFSGESKDAEDFRIKFAQKTAEYVEETLNPHFGDLISFCSEAEALIEKGWNYMNIEYLQCNERGIFSLSLAVMLFYLILHCISQRRLDPGKETLERFFQVGNQKEYQNVLIISFVYLEKIKFFCFMH